MWKCPDNQEVGLEAAILQRVRNSSLVESARADDLAGIKRVTEAMDGPCRTARCMVGERRARGEAAAEAAVEGARVRMPV